MITWYAAHTIEYAKFIDGVQDILIGKGFVLFERTKQLKALGHECTQLIAVVSH